MGSYGRDLRKRMKGAKAAPTKDRGMSEDEFMTQRRMFCLAPEGLRVAARDDNRGHRAWMSDMDERTFEGATRGYHLAPDLVFYRGGFDPVSPRQIAAALPALREALGLPLDTRVWMGAVECQGGALRGRDDLGTIEEGWMDAVEAGDVPVDDVGDRR